MMKIVTQKMLVGQGFDIAALRQTGHSRDGFVLPGTLPPWMWQRESDLPVKASGLVHQPQHRLRRPVRGRPGVHRVTRPQPGLNPS